MGPGQPNIRLKIGPHDVWPKYHEMGLFLWARAGLIWKRRGTDTRRRIYFYNKKGSLDSVPKTTLSRLVGLGPCRSLRIRGVQQRGFGRLSGVECAERSRD